MKYQKSFFAIGMVVISLFGLIYIAALVKQRLAPGDREVVTEVASAETQFEVARRALSATENLDTKQADADWSLLYEQMPSDKSVAINRALNRVLQVDSLTEATTNALLSAEEKQGARRQLPLAIEQARTAIDEFSVVSEDKVTQMWLASRIDLQEASLLPASLGKSLRQEIFTRLSSAIEGDLKDEPKSIILGGPLLRVLDELESPINGIPSDILKRAAQATAALSGQQPDNLYVALRAARLNITAKSDDAVGPVQRTQELAKAIEPSLRATTQSIGLTPDELVQKIVDAIKQQDWQTADNQMNLWFNVLNSTDLVKTDRRRSSPHPLDRLSFDLLRRLSADIVKLQPVAGSTAVPTFKEWPDAGATDTVAALSVDIDLDLKPDVVAVTSKGTLTAWKNGGTDSFTKSGTIELGMKCRGLLSADLFMVDATDPNRLQASSEPATDDGTKGEKAADAAGRHTTFPTLLVYGDDGVKLISVDGRASTDDGKRFAIVPSPTGLEDVTQVATSVTGDLEGDGDLDVIFATRNLGVRVFINRGNRTFFESSSAGNENAMSSLTSLATMAIVDLDRDLDLDVVAVNGETGKVGLIENLLHLQFRYRELADVPPTSGAYQIHVADIDGNVSWDLVVGGKEQLNVIYSNTAEAGAWVVDRSEKVGLVATNFLVADIDNDSWDELIASTDKGPVIRRLVDPGQKELGEAIGGVRGACVSNTDFDLDGKLDLLTIAEGSWLIAQNVSASSGHHVDVRIKGIDDNNANSGRVNHYAIGSVLELRFGPHYRAQVITTPTTHFGMNGFDKAATLRIIFPNGLTQTIPELGVDMLVEEEQTLKGSCPYLYTWDGEKYAFVTDCLWAAPLGLQVAAGVVAKDRPWEYLKVDGDHVRVREGRYEFRITEELWEVAYFDHVSLSAIDHPADVDIWTNEKVGPAEIAKPTIYAFSPQDLRPLKHAVDTMGRDITQQLSSIDKAFVQGFDRRLRQGLCPPHWVDLDFGTLPPRAATGTPIYLVLTGWILPTDTSLNIQIDQNPELPSIEFPSVWVPDSAESGGWRKAIPFMGFPGGKTKTIVVDVTDILNSDDPRLRVRTSAQLYWDAAQLVVQSETPKVTTHLLELDSAEVHYHGFSKRVESGTNSPESYDYAMTNTAPKWPPLKGRFTSLGDCRPLLSQWDDSMVVMGSGDEIRLQFVAPTAEIPQGWKRDFVLHCVGWDKDADLNTLTGQSSEPLPFKGMTAYPPTHAQADEATHRFEQNVRHLQRTQSFRDFWNR